MAKPNIYSSENPDKDISKNKNKREEIQNKKAFADIKKKNKPKEKKTKEIKDTHAQGANIPPEKPENASPNENGTGSKKGSRLLWAVPLILLLFGGASYGSFYYYENILRPIKEIPLYKAAPKTTKFRASTWFSDYKAMIRQVHLYDDVHPFIYGLQGGRHNNGLLTRSWSSKKVKARIKEMREINPKVKIIPTIFRWENRGEQIYEAIGMGGRADIRDKHIREIIKEIERFSYDGIDIDYEGMDCAKKEKFEEFIVLLSKELKKRKKLLSIAVHPKTPLSKNRSYQKKCAGLKKSVTVDFKENWRGPMAHDYELLARYADMIKIMAYELHPRKYRNPGPGPQAPTHWLKDIIKYARKKVSADKLYMAIPTYGYDWSLNCRKSIRAVYYADAQRIKKYSKKIQPTNLNALYKKKGKNWSVLHKLMYIHKGIVYDDPSLFYNENGCDRIAFYMNKSAFESKMNVLRGFDLAGFSFWQLVSDNDPAINGYLKKLIENKLPDVPSLNHELLEGIPHYKKPVGVFSSKITEKNQTKANKKKSSRKNT